MRQARLAFSDVFLGNAGAIAAVSTGGALRVRVASHVGFGGQNTRKPGRESRPRDYFRQPGRGAKEVLCFLRALGGDVSVEMVFDYR